MESQMVNDNLQFPGIFWLGKPRPSKVEARLVAGAEVRRLQARLARITVAGRSRWDTSTPENLVTGHCNIISQNSHVGHGLHIAANLPSRKQLK